MIRALSYPFSPGPRYTKHPRTRNLPEIGPLMVQIKKAYNLSNLETSEELIYRQAWAVKHGCGLVKRKGQRGELTRETLIYLKAVCYCHLLTVGREGLFSRFVMEVGTSHTHKRTSSDPAHPST